MVIQYTVYSIQYTVYNLQYTVYTPERKIKALQNIQTGSWELGTDGNMSR